jgi:hypothetical protein
MGLDGNMQRADLNNPISIGLRTCMEFLLAPVRGQGRVDRQNVPRLAKFPITGR